MNISIVHSFAAFMVLFAVIDIIGSIPIIIDIKNRGNKIESLKITLISLLILSGFLIVGEALLGFFGVDIASFAIAGSFILFFLAMEMVLDINVFKNDTPGGSSIVPIAFPLIAGAGSITTLLSLRSQYSTANIMIALVVNMIVVFAVLKSTGVIERVLGATGIAIMRKIFGIILLAIAIKLFMSNLATSIESNFPEIFDYIHQKSALPNPSINTN
ncbi:MAG: MarC family protein [Bacteroidota bacterium]|nr:MarC family protein [Bacteroidota bacterium]